MGTKTFSRAGALIVVGLGLAVACSDPTPNDAAPSDGTSTSSSSGGASSSSSSSSSSSTGGPAVGEACTAGAMCTGKDRRRVCNGTTWVDETCAAGSGCFQGACVVGRCADECTLGDVEAQSKKTCAAWDVAKSGAAALDQTTKLHDRARGYLGWMKKGPMLSGSIGSAHFTDAPAFEHVDAMHGIGDSAIWTGAYLAAEAFHFQATGSSDARARVRSLVDTMHLMLKVAGEPGMLARWVKPASKTFDFSIPDYNCTVERVHCGVDYAGAKYDYIGHISRDQYQGVMFGLATAYDALSPATDEDMRAIIRADIVEIVRELMKERTVLVRLTFNGVVMTPKEVTARFIVVSPREMVDGAIDLRLDTDNTDDSKMFGFQEFYPNLAHLVRQMPGLSWVPDIKRASSAIMLASFFSSALHVTDGVPSAKKDHDEILDYYINHAGEGGSVNDWLNVAKEWTADKNCGGDYYANNITMMPMYTLARVEDVPSLSVIVKNEVLTAKLWPAFENMKNTFFSFIYAGTVAPSNATTIATSALDQLTGFPVAPRTHRAIDLRESPKYTTRDPSCADQVAHDTAVDVADRITGDFMWQRHPWGLVHGGDANQTEPGVDYLLAYFMGRHHGFITDDTPSVCLAWQ